MNHLRYLLVLILLALVLPQFAAAQVANEFFQKNCVACHTIGGGRLIGPDLKEAVQQKDRAWLERFIQDPHAVLNSGDPYALQLEKDANGMVMPTMPGVTPEMAKALLDMIELEAKLPASASTGGTVTEKPFTAEDVSAGTEIFLGMRSLNKAGPPCISCHTLGTLNGLGGGRLGPDLTLVYVRLGGRRALGGWLSAPPTSTMQSIFRDHALQPDEITDLLSVFEMNARTSQPANSRSLVNFSLAGLAGAFLGLAIMGWAWRGRFRTVRRAMVSGAQRGAV